MKGLSMLFGRGLLVLALSSCFVACGDDDDDDMPDGSTAGSSGAAGAAGKSMAGASGKGGSGGSMAGTSGTMNKTCEEKVDAAATAAMASDKCVSCLCDMKPVPTEACTGDCFKLAFCVASSGCGTTDVACIKTKCMAKVNADMTKYMDALTKAAATPFVACAKDCFNITPPDGSTDAGH